MAPPVEGLLRGQSVPHQVVEPVLLRGVHHGDGGEVQQRGLLLLLRPLRRRVHVGGALVHEVNVVRDVEAGAAAGGDGVAAAQPPKIDIQ